MLPELSKLIEVQELDKVIQEVTGELERLPEELKTEAAALEDLKAQQAAHLQEVENLKTQRRDTETETAEMEEGIKRSRARLMEIKSNIEYKAMIKEIALPTHALLTRHNLLPVFHHRLHARLTREREDGVQMIRHEQTKTAVPDELFVIVLYCCKHGVANISATQLILSGRHTFDGDEEPTAFADP